MNAPLPQGFSQTASAASQQSRPTVVLPSAAGERAASVNDCAQKLSEVLGNKRVLFVRSGVVHEIRAENDGLTLHVITPQALAGLTQRHVELFAWRKPKDDAVQKPVGLMPLDVAKILLATPEAREYLPPIASVLAQPGLIEVDGQLVTMMPGYNPAGGGTIVTSSTVVPEVPLAEAVQSLSDLLRDFQFATPGDRARAIAAVVTPALRHAQLIAGHVPILMVEADHSRTGKGFFLEMLTGIYGEKASMVTPRKGGVGSLDESISQRLIEGRPFIQIDNVRGMIDSMMLESLLTSTAPINARVPGLPEVACDPTRFLICMTSNGASTTVDLANRACIVRLRKQPKGYTYHQWPVEGADFRVYVEARQAYLLGCVHSVIRAWWDQGRKCVPDRGQHSFRKWAGILGWITTTLFRTCDLLDGHEEVQKRLANPAHGWVRAVAARIIQRQDPPTKHWSASNLVELCQEASIDIPGIRTDSDDKAQAKMVGTLMRRVFGCDDNDEFEIDTYVVKRIKYKDSDGHDQKVYNFQLRAAQ